MVKLRDIAERVGVSISTVSRVLNHDANRSVSEETRRKIWEVAEQIGYHKVRSAKTQQNPPDQGHRIGCVVASPQNKYNNPYFSVILEGIEKALSDAGMRLEFILSIEQSNDIEVLIDNVKAKKVDGIIVVERVDPEVFAWLKANVKVVVGIDIDDPAIPVVGYDREMAAKEAVQHLIAQGHREIGYIGGPELNGDFRKEKRYLGYARAMQEAGLPIDDHWVINVNWDVSLSFELTKKAFEESDRYPTAIFSASDMMAIPAIRAVTEQGLSIPDDVAFFSVDNIQISAFTSPPLSTVHVPKTEMGMYAVKLLLDYLDQDDLFPVKVLIPYRLIVRQSSNKTIAED